MTDDLTAILDSINRAPSDLWQQEFMENFYSQWDRIYKEAHASGDDGRISGIEFFHREYMWPLYLHVFNTQIILPNMMSLNDALKQEQPPKTKGDDSTLENEHMSLSDADVEEQTRRDAFFKNEAPDLAARHGPEEFAEKFTALASVVRNDSSLLGFTEREQLKKAMRAFSEKFEDVYAIPAITGIAL